ncbi:hypothetical protein [Alloactinosynnema sp. L-07]|nr:hypothetical protein [Alloactinosynnema sp. L-07]
MLVGKLIGWEQFAARQPRLVARGQRGERADRRGIARRDGGLQMPNPLVGVPLQQVIKSLPTIPAPRG